MNTKRIVIVFLNILPAAGSLLLFFFLNSSFWGNRLLVSVTGGYGMPDLLIFSGPAEIAGHISRMGETGFSLYKKISLEFDFLFPLFYGLFLIQVISAACRFSGIKFRFYLVLFPILASVSDISENLLFLKIMNSSTADFTSINTVHLVLNIKYLFFGLSVFLIILLLLWKLRKTHPII